MKTRHLLAICLLAAMLVQGVVALPVAAQAPTNLITVTSNADSGPGTLRQALFDIVAGGTINFNLPANTKIVLNGRALVIDKNMVIDGSTGTGLTVDGDNRGTVFRIIGSAVHVTIKSLTITNANASYEPEGGGIRNSGILTLEQCIISGNQTGFAYVGAGIYNTGTVTLTQSVVSNNMAGEGVGGIFNTGRLIVNQSTIKHNFQGGISNNGGYTTILHSAIHHNSGFGIGGLANTSGTVEVINSTISDNSSHAGPGAIWNAGNMVLLNSTIANNLNTSPGSGFSISNHGTLEMTNTMVVDDDKNLNCTGNAVTSHGNNMGSDATCSLVGPGDQQNIKPLVKPLADNGGPTFTNALRANSPAIDAGNATTCPPTDQRNEPRPKDGNGDRKAVCDIGAYELQMSPQVRNRALHLDSVQASYDPTPAPNAPAGVFTFSTRFTNKTATALRDPFFKVTILTGGNLLLNASTGDGKMGSTLSGPDEVAPGANFTVDFTIGLQRRQLFIFFVDAYALPTADVTAAEVDADSNAPGFDFAVNAEQLQIESTIYLPLIER